MELSRHAVVFELVVVVVVAMMRLLWCNRLNRVCPYTRIELKLMSRIRLIISDFKVLEFCYEIDVQVRIVFTVRVLKFVINLLGAFWLLTSN